MALEFERAAELRDQISMLRRVQDQQSMEGGTGDVDVAAVMLTPGGACVHLISVRGGRVLGSKNFFPQVAIEEEGGDVLMAFLAQYYLGNAERDLPSELIVNVQHEDFATLIEAIESLRGRSLSISLRVRGTRARWQQLAVTNAEQALAARAQLVEGESLISRDGYWVGRHFLRVRRASEAESGVLARGQELQRLLAERDEREASLAAMEDRVTALSGEQSRLEGERELQRRQQQEEARKHSDLKARLSAGHARLEQLALRRRRLEEELAEQQEQREIETEQLGEARLQLQEALETMAQDTEQRETLLASRDGIRERLDRIRQDARQHKDHAHQLALRVGSLRAQHESTRQALERLEQQFEREDEESEIVATWVPLDDAVAAVLDGSLHNPNLVIGVLAAHASRAAGWSSLRPADAAWPAHPGLRGTDGLTPATITPPDAR